MNVTSFFQSCWRETVLAPREIDEYLLPTERRVIRVRQHWAFMLTTSSQTALFLLLMVVAQRYLPAGVLVDNVTFYLCARRGGAVHRARRSCGGSSAS